MQGNKAVTADGLQRVTVYVQPGAKETDFAGYHNGFLKIRLKAPAVDGKANQALIIFMASYLNIRKQDIEIVSGHKSRLKTLEISNISSPQAPQGARGKP